ncbi:MAG TPA: immunoglobulin domain-containing protein [Planctomycetota bacterium]|nr:immunoglobulin domain-containing protein [Planctomycetota bacterium]
MKRVSLLLFLCGAVFASAAENPLTDAKNQALGPLAGKLDSRLIPAISSLHAGNASSTELGVALQRSLARSLPAAPAGKFALTLDVPHVNSVTLNAISATGAEVIHSSAQWNTVMAVAALEQIDALTKLDGVRSIALAHRPRVRQQGVAANQGDGSMKADQARAQTGASGAGQKIGVISDFINKTNLADGVTPIGVGTVTGTVPNATLSGLNDQTSGDLPAAIQVIDFGPDPGFVPPAPDNNTIPLAGNEGAAMMETIHDVAPNAALAFASGFYNQTMMAANLAALRSAGCTITVDDFSYPDEPFFQDGPIAQAIQANVAAGVPHFVAVGNDGDQGVLATYTPINGGAPNDSGITPSGNFFHNWGIGGQTPGFLPIDLPDGANVTFILQWNQPYASYNLGPGSSVDLDLFLYDGTNLATANILGFSNDPQFVGGQPSGDPHEILDYSNTTGATQRVYLAVNNYAGTRNNVILRLVASSDLQLSFPSGGTGGMTAYGHAALSDAISVGAVFFGDIDSGGLFGPDTTNVNAEDFSSKGGIGANGVPYYFDTTGAAIANGPLLRDIPDIAAPDGGNTTFFGTFTQYKDSNGVIYGSDQYQKFFGTSASASNAAAVAALMLEQASLSTPAQLKLALKTAATDVVATAPLSVAGPDDRTGAGLINALSVIGLVPSVSAPANQTILVGQTATFAVTAGGSATLTYQWQKNNKSIPGATNSSLMLTNVPGTDDQSTYRCIVSNAYGTAVSASALLTVHNPPQIKVQPADQVVNLGASATFTIQAVNDPLTYQWQRNTNGTVQNIQGAVAATLSVTSVAITDDQSQFRCIVTNPYGSTTSNYAKLTVNVAPGIVSGPTATPQAAKVGQPIGFSASAVGARNQPVTYSWDFGDGTNAPGASVAHAYGAAQDYTVTLSVTDQSNATTTATITVYVFNDANGDGLPDLDPSIDNAPFVDAYKVVGGLTAQELNVTKMSIGLNFAKTGSDIMNVSGTLPIPGGFVVVGQNVIAVIGGVGRSFTLDSKGKSKATPNGTFQLTFKKKNPGAQFAKYAMKLTKADIKTILADAGLTNETVKKIGVNVRATIFFNSGMFDKLQPQTYTATKGKTGKTK